MEKFALPKIEQLPLTIITESAKEKLKSWGLNGEQIGDLRSFLSQFRYDLCPKKIEELSRKPAEIFKINDKEYINFPSFFDVDGRLLGQCVDIAYQWIIKINESGLIKKLNQNRTSNQRLVTCFYKGLSETHFRQDDSLHTWNGLALIDKKGRVKDEIFFDAAFQKIMDKKESNYSPKTSIFNVKSVAYDENNQTSIGWVEFNDDKWNAVVPESTVLGISDDFKYIFCLAFCRDKKTEQICPIICRIDSFGEKCYFLYRNDPTLGKLLLISDNQELSNISYHEQTEIKNLFDKSLKISFVEKKPTVNTVKWRQNIFGFFGSKKIQ